MQFEENDLHQVGHIYNRYSYDIEKQLALEAWDREVEQHHHRHRERRDSNKTHCCIMPVTGHHNWLTLKVYECNKCDRIESGTTD